MMSTDWVRIAEAVELRDGEGRVYPLTMRMATLRWLERQAGEPFSSLFDRFQNSSWTVDDLYLITSAGLIGGNGDLTHEQAESIIDSCAPGDLVTAMSEMLSAAFGDDATETGESENDQGNATAGTGAMPNSRQLESVSDQSSSGR